MTHGKTLILRNKQSREKLRTDKRNKKKTFLIRNFFKKKKNNFTIMSRKLWLPVGFGKQARQDNTEMNIAVLHFVHFSDSFTLDINA